MVSRAQGRVQPLPLPALGAAIGSNLGASLAPIGALAGILWMTILHGKEVRITFPEFVKYGLLVIPPEGSDLVPCILHTRLFGGVKDLGTDGTRDHRPKGGCSPVCLTAEA